MDPTNELIATTTGVPVVGYDIITPLMGWIFGNVGDVGGIVGFFSSLWTVYVVIAYAVSGLMLGIYIYATIRKGQLVDMQDELLKHSEQVYDEQYRTGPKNDRLNDVLTHSSSLNPNDWKLAIIEADIILDEGLKKAGYVGNSLGERLRGISRQQMQSLDDAWEAHKVRNKVAHGGADFVLTKRLVDDTMKQYRRVFAELGLD